MISNVYAYVEAKPLVSAVERKIVQNTHEKSYLHTYHMPHPTANEVSSVISENGYQLPGSGTE